MDVQSLNLLLVEDSDPDVFLFAKFLSQRSNAPNLQRVKNGEQALDVIFHRNEYAESEITPDAVVLDLNLPRVTGYEVLGVMKGSDATSKIPVILLTTSHSTIDKERCMALGAQAYLIKPDDLMGYQDLAARLMDIELPKAAANQP